jgi:hypothetical protein
MLPRIFPNTTDLKGVAQVYGVGFTVQYAESAACRGPTLDWPSFGRGVCGITVESEHFSIQSNADKSSCGQVTGNSEDKEEATVDSRRRLSCESSLAITLFPG